MNCPDDYITFSVSENPRFEKNKNMVCLHKIGYDKVIMIICPKKDKN